MRIISTPEDACLFDSIVRCPIVILNSVSLPSLHSVNTTGRSSAANETDQWLWTRHTTCMQGVAKNGNGHELTHPVSIS